jgi:hypothetical protein
MSDVFQSNKVEGAFLGKLVCLATPAGVVSFRAEDLSDVVNVLNALLDEQLQDEDTTPGPRQENDFLQCVSDYLMSCERAQGFRSITRHVRKIGYDVNRDAAQSYLLEHIGPGKAFRMTESGRITIR